MPTKESVPEVQLKVVQRNYDSISKLMHCKQQECDKVFFVISKLAVSTDHPVCQLVIPCFLCSYVWNWTVLAPKCKMQAACTSKPLLEQAMLRPR